MIPAQDDSGFEDVENITITPPYPTAEGRDGLMLAFNDETFWLENELAIWLLSRLMKFYADYIYEALGLDDDDTVVELEG